MLENRSFDNVLGWLYDSKNEPPFDSAPRGQSFEGLSGKFLTNPIPGGDTEVTECLDMVAPHPNPNESFDDVYRQMYNDEPPPDPSKPLHEPSGPPLMQGFALNYASAIDAYKKAHPDKEVTTTPGDIMRCYLPKSLPVINGLANAYAVYEALRDGPGWPETLLIITFDEHGGCYDHVAPPAAAPPDDVVIPPGEPGGSGFTFNPLGVRVPAVIVSPLIEPGAICHTVFDHTSIIKTVINCFGLKDAQGNPATLGNRVSAAKDVGEVITLGRPREDAPKIEPLPLPQH